MKGKRTRGNGMGTAYRMKNGKWQAEAVIGWKNGNRVRRTKAGFKTKKEAIAYIPILKSEPIRIDTKIKFKDLYDLWSEPHYTKIGRDTENGYRAAYKHCENLYYRTFTDLKTQDLQEIIDNCIPLPKMIKKDGKLVEKQSDDLKELGRRAKADIKSLFTNLYKYAIENDYCNKNYAQFIKLPPKEKSKKDAFTAEEREALWADYRDGHEFTGNILVMIYTGMRYGEISTIKKENVHLKERYLIGGIKTEAGIDRVIPICGKIYPIVAKMFLAGKKKILEIPEKMFYNEYRVTLKRLGMRYLNPHCCRHTCASALAEAGIQPAIIKEILGHEDYSTTLGYTHISLEEKLNAVDSL